MASKAAKSGNVSTKPAKKTARKAAPKAAAAGNVATPTVVRAFVIPGKDEPEKAQEAGSVATQAVRYPPSFVPTTEAEMAACLADPVWRICSGQRRAN